MERLWLVINPASGSTDATRARAIEALFVERGLAFVGRTVFPDEPLPDIAALDAAGADTLVLFAGDGTINAAACRLDAWPGEVLILPGGTMNLLARRLHGDAEPAAIVHAAHISAHTVRLPFVEAGPHRAFVALIAGPVASWARAREIVRRGRFAALGRAVRFAWRRSWSDRIAVRAGGRIGRYNAVFVQPEDGRLAVAAIAAERWADIARLGWDWLTGDWHDAPAVDTRRATKATIAGRRTIQALFDGEEAMLPSPVTIGSGLSRLRFVSTVEA